MPGDALCSPLLESTPLASFILREILEGRYDNLTIRLARTIFNCRDCKYKGSSQCPLNRARQ